MPGVPAVLRVTQEGVVRDVLEARTGEDGIATLRHASVALDASIVRDGARWSLALASCIDPPVETPVEVLDSGALHELVQPDVGNLEVRVEDVDGVPAPDGVEVALVARARDGREPATRERAESRIHSAVHPEFGGRERAAGVMRATTQGGLARFHGVGLGLEFWVGASRHACSAAAFTNGQGPRDEGETTRIVLRFGEERLVVRGRILDVVGKPLADRAVFSSFHMRPPRGGWSHPQRLHVLPPMQVASALRAHEVLGHGEPRTAADGRYSADCGWHGLPGGTLVWVVQCCAGTPDHALAEVAIPAPNERGIVEVGDVRLTPAPVILEGRVVDELGAPVVSVTIHPGGDDEAMNQSLAVDEHGRFMLRGFALAPEVGALAVDVRFGAERSGMRKVGARDVEIVLRRTGEIVGRILPPPPASEAAWIARIVREDTLRDPRGVPDQHPVDPHGRVHFVWREPGLYRLELLRGSPPVVVASRGGLRVEPDQLLDVGTIEIDPK
ncbi:MAG: hypothetical protein HZA53_04355 [Planctomycetes bacterium]|nr:hypothetical protein [Planctomycetota bacterium]